MTIGNVLATTFRLWARNLLRLLVLAFVFYAPIVAWQLLSVSEWGSDFIMEHYYTPLLELHPVLYSNAGADWIPVGMLNAAVATVIVTAVRGERPRIGRGFAIAFRRFFTIFVTSLVVRLATVGVISACFVWLWDRYEWMYRGEGTYIAWGLLWILLQALFLIVIPIVAIERRGIFGSLRASFAILRGHRIKAFILVLLLTVLSYGLHYLLYEIMVPSPYGDVSSYGTRIQIYGYVTFGIEILWTTLFATLAAVTYERAREAKEGPHTTQLHTVFE